MDYVTREEKEFFMACIKMGIRKITKKEFKKWLRIKDTLEFIMIQKLPIIVTTCKAAKGKIFEKIHFSKVIIDEATQSHELETLETIIEAQ